MAIFLITAPSGAGKTTVAHNLASRGVWKECISHTTRPIRKGEVDGKTYYYISKEKFEAMQENNMMAEAVTYDGHMYGIDKQEISRVQKLSKNIYIIVEYEGYKQVKSQYPEAIGIFLYMSKEDCLANMLLRGDSMENAMKRIEKYDSEMKNSVEYDYVIKNVRGAFPNTCNIVNNIILSYLYQ